MVLLSMFLLRNHNKGISIIEILIAVAIIGISFSSILGVATLSLRQTGDTGLEARATALAKETMEVVITYRNGIAWNNDDPADEYDGLGVVSLLASYYPKLSQDVPAKWQLVQGQEQVDGFTRDIVFADVSRDANSNIVEQGGTIDPNTKKATATVLWQDRGTTRQVQLLMYLTNWKDL